MGVGQDARLLEIAVGKIPGHVLRGDDVVLDVTGEGCSPQCRWMARGEDDATHPGLGGIH